MADPAAARTKPRLELHFPLAAMKILLEKRYLKSVSNTGAGDLSNVPD